MRHDMTYNPRIISDDGNLVCITVIVFVGSAQNYLQFLLYYLLVRIEFLFIRGQDHTMVLDVIEHVHERLQLYRIVIPCLVEHELFFHNHQLTCMSSRIS